MNLASPYRQLTALALGVLLAALVISVPLSAQTPLGLDNPEPAATVEAVSGTVESYAPGVQRRALSQGDLLFPGDSIALGADGSALLRLNDQSTAQLYEDTVLAINDILPEEPGDASFSLFTGTMVVDAGDLRGQDLVITPTLTVGIRGTRFSVVVAEDGASVVIVEEGEVAASSAAGDEAEACVAPGQEVVATESAANLAPREASMISAQDWRDFRQARQEALLAAPDQAAADLEHEIDTRLEQLATLEARPMDRAEMLAKLQSELENLGPDQEDQRSQIILQAHMETARALGLVREFRAERMRLEAVFIQAERLAVLLDSSSADNNEQRQAAENSLVRIQGRQAQVQEHVAAIAQRFEESVSPLRRHFIDFEELRGQGCARGETTIQGRESQAQ